MKKTLIALTTAVLLTGAMGASAQSAYGSSHDDGYYSETYRDRYASTRDDMDQDGVYDPYDDYDDRRGTSWDQDLDGMNDRYELDNRNGYDDRNGYDSRTGYNDRDRDGVPNRSDGYDNRSGYRYRDGVPNRSDRNDGRNDNRRHFARHRYQAGRYYGPRHYRYVRYNVGSRLPMGYYGNTYYIDYRPYGLASPPRGYRWNRVGNDAYLVSVTNGLVRDVMYSLFY